MFKIASFKKKKKIESCTLYHFKFDNNIKLQIKIKNRENFYETLFEALKGKGA